MERLCFQMDLVPGAEAEYVRRHDEIWPEMVAALAASGFENYSLFRRGTSVIGYAECVPDIATVNAAMAATEVNGRWGASFDGVIASMSDSEDNLVSFTQLWHLEDHR